MRVRFFQLTMVDYTLYLVTDLTMVPQGCTFLDQVRQLVENGATIVQLREKHLLTRDFIERAQQVQEICRAKNVPLIINDRVDVALAVDADGIHVGQDDMPAKTVRQLIGPDKILGVTCSTPEELHEVVDEGVADYVGIGTVYPTNTKKDVTNPRGTGPIGIRKMLSVLGQHNSKHDQIRCVAIGGVNHSNASKVMFQCRVGDQGLDGVAVVSCIMALPDAGKATASLDTILREPPKWSVSSSTELTSDVMALVSQHSPLVHHITNDVVKNFSANVTLAIGASPIMSELACEYFEFARAPHVAGLINLGTPDDSTMALFTEALRVYNDAGKHIVFDPVACGATAARLEATTNVLNAGQVSVIKGNVGEISAVHKLCSTYASTASEELMRGVDSLVSMSDDKVAAMASEVAREFKCVVVVTGKTNIVSTATDSHKVAGGGELMGRVTGTGCSLGSVIAAALAVTPSFDPKHVANAVVDAVKRYNEAGAAAIAALSGPGAFLSHFLDQLYV